MIRLKLTCPPISGLGDFIQPKISNSGGNIFCETHLPTHIWEVGPTVAPGIARFHFWWQGVKTTPMMLTTVTKDDNIFFRPAGLCLNVGLYVYLFQQQPSKKIQPDTSLPWLGSWLSIYAHMYFVEMYRIFLFVSLPGCSSRKTTLKYANPELLSALFRLFILSKHPMVIGTLQLLAP